MPGSNWFIKDTEQPVPATCHYKNKNKAHKYTQTIHFLEQKRICCEQTARRKASFDSQVFSVIAFMLEPSNQTSQ